MCRAEKIMACIYLLTPRIKWNKGLTEPAHHLLPLQWLFNGIRHCIVGQFIWMLYHFNPLLITLPHGRGLHTVAPKIYMLRLCVPTVTQIARNFLRLSFRAHKVDEIDKKIPSLMEKRLATLENTVYSINMALKIIKSKKKPNIWIC